MSALFRLSRVPAGAKIRLALDRCSRAEQDSDLIWQYEAALNLFRDRQSDDDREGKDQTE